MNDSITPPLPIGARIDDGDMVGVDSGCMAITASGCFHASELFMFHTIHDTVAGEPQIAVSSAGFGDGGYDLLKLRTSDGRVSGVEVVFILVDEDEVRNADPEKFEEDPHGQLQEAYDRLLTTEDPRNLGEPRVISEIVVFPASPTLEVGDPCYGKSSVTVQVIPGRYVAVAYEADMGEWGTRVMRLGAYLAEPA